ncbi:hypothetical protein VPH35_113639 [Triticum aestivum]
MRGPGGGVGPGEPPPAAEEVVEENSGGEEELELGLCLGSRKLQLLQQPAPPAPCRILTARDLQPAAALSPDSSVSSSSPAAAKADDGPAPAASPGTLASGHPQRSVRALPRLSGTQIKEYSKNLRFLPAKVTSSASTTCLQIPYQNPQDRF